MELKQMVPLFLGAIALLVVVGAIVHFTTRDYVQSEKSESPVEPTCCAEDLDIGGDLAKGDATLLVWNFTTEVLCEVYAAPDGDDDWGDNLVAQSPVMPRGRVRISLPAGMYKLKAVDCMQFVLAEEHGVKIDGEFLWGLNYDPEAPTPEGLQLGE